MMARNPTIGMFVGDAEIKRRKNVRRDLQAIGTLTEQTCRDKAQEVVIATERVLGEKFNVAARHELVNQIVATFATSVSAPVGTGKQPLCAVHKRLGDANALECEIGNNCVACSLNERRELLQLIAPFAAACNTEDSVTVLRRVAEFYATHGQGWLLEKMHDGNVHYISADYVLQWTDDPNKALRLARREDAEALCTIVEDCEKIASHEWVTSD